MITYLFSKYLINLAKRAATDGHVATAEIINAPKIIDKVYGDGDGVLEFSDAVDAVTTIGGNFVDKVEHVIDFFGDLF